MGSFTRLPNNKSPHELYPQSDRINETSNRGDVVLTIEWGTLHIMEHVPTWVAVALTIDALLMLGVLESRNWLIFKGKNYFRYSFTALILAYAAIVAAPSFLPFRTVAVAPPLRQEDQPAKEFEAQKSTLIEWLQKFQRERDEARQERDQLRTQLQISQTQHPPDPIAQRCADLAWQLVEGHNPGFLIGPMSEETKKDIRSAMTMLHCNAAIK